MNKARLRILTNPATARAESHTTYLPFELGHQTLQFDRHACQFIGRSLRIRGPFGRAAGGLRHTHHILGDLATSDRGFATLREISAVVAVCCSTALAIVL